MLESLKEKLASDVDSLVERLEADIPSAEAAASAARGAQTDTLLAFHEGKASDVALEKTRKAVQAADDTLAGFRSSLRGAIERRDALAAMRQNKANSDAHAALKVKRDAALAVADESDRLAREMGAAVEQFAAVRSRLIAKRSQLAALVQELGGIDDLSGAALVVSNFDALIKVDMGAQGLTAYGPPFNDPSRPRPVSLAERITGGSAIIKAQLRARVPD